MIVRWRTSSYPPNKIERVECTRETEMCVYIASISGREHRSLKHSNHEQYHNTWADAKAYLLDRAKSKVDLAKASLHKARTALGQIESLKEPT